MTIYNNLFNIKYIVLQFYNYSNIMALMNFSILYCLYNCIDTNKRCSGNEIHVCIQSTLM